MVDIHSVGIANSHASSRGAGPNETLQSQASSTKAIHANGIVGRAAPAKGKPGVLKASQKRDPAEVQRERQLADEQNVRSNEPCHELRRCTALYQTNSPFTMTRKKHHKSPKSDLFHSDHVSIQSILNEQKDVKCRCAWRSVRSGISWQMGCGPWQALHRAADPLH